MKMTSLNQLVLMLLALPILLTGCAFPTNLFIECDDNNEKVVSFENSPAMKGPAMVYGIDLMLEKSVGDWLFYVPKDDPNGMLFVLKKGNPVAIIHEGSDIDHENRVLGRQAAIEIFNRDGTPAISLERDIGSERYNKSSLTSYYADGIANDYVSDHGLDGQPDYKLKQDKHYKLEEFIWIDGKWKKAIRRDKKRGVMSGDLWKEVKITKTGFVYVEE